MLIVLHKMTTTDTKRRWVRPVLTREYDIYSDHLKFLDPKYYNDFPQFMKDAFYEKLKREVNI